MKYPHMERHGEIEMYRNTFFLHHIALLQAGRKRETTKKDLLLLYLLGNRFITRYQIMNLLSYRQTVAGKAVDTFINRLVKNGMLRKDVSRNKERLEDTFTASGQGSAAGREIFIRTLKEIYDSPKNEFHKTVSILIWNEPSNIEEYADLLAEYISRQYRAHALRHQAAVRDTYIYFLRNLTPAAVQEFRTEESFSDGDLNRSAIFSRAKRSDLRCDAVCSLSLEWESDTVYHYSNDSLLVCMEQDTMSQSSKVLADKLSRYISKLLVPRMEYRKTPPVLVFSILPHLWEAKKEDKRLRVRSRDRSYVDNLECFIFLYCRYAGVTPEELTLEQLEWEMRGWEKDAGEFKKYTAYLSEYRKKYGRDFPISRMKELYRKISSTKYKSRPIYWDYRSSYSKRRDTVFSVVMQCHSGVPAAINGFSVCTSNNYEPATLISLFPSHNGANAILKEFIRKNSKDGAAVAYLPFYKHTCGNGKVIVFRNAYQCGQEVCVVENVSGDVCGEIRLKYLFSNEPSLFVRVVAIIAREDYVRASGVICGAASAQQKKKPYYLLYEPTEDGGIRFGLPSLF